MNWNTRIRQSHRWVSLAFTLAVIATSVLLALGKTAAWVSLLPLPPLAILLLTGVYLFALPYVAKRRPRPAR